ncbi:MAG: AAA family ATPase [Oscillospiraceae bacterium]|nr:AAA family ATPase [Oscillospiraceae bacterium]
MIIKAINIEQGLFCTERHFTPGFNLIYSEENSTGKTTLLRCILYGMGYGIPGTKKFRMESTSIHLAIEKDNGTELILKRERADCIELIEAGQQYSFALPAQLHNLHEKLFGTNNADILDNLLGAFYADQEKGWTLLNRGKAIAGIRFNIDELIRGLSGRSCEELLLKRRKVEDSIKKYKQILNIAEYRDKLTVDVSSFTGLDYNRERLLRIAQLKVEKDAIKKEIKRLDNNIANNKKTIELIESMKLIIQLPTGEEICVTPDMIVGAVDSVELLKAKKKILIPQLEATIK